MQLTLSERRVIVDALEPTSLVRKVLDRFCSAQELKYDARCSENMRSVPRKYEEASDNASKSQAYREFMLCLIREIEQASVED